MKQLLSPRGPLADGAWVDLTDSRTASRPTLDRRGHTLIEMVLSMVVLSIVLLAIGSAIVLASHAIPDAPGPSAAVATAAEVVEQIAGELSFARSFLERTANAIEFTVADRDGDLIAETIRYAFSGTPGDPLTRQYNGGTVVWIIEAAEEFELFYDTTIVNEQKVQESAEVLLDSKVSAADDLTTWVTPTNWYGQYIQPSLPAGATSWTVTRILFQAQDSPNPGNAIWVQLRPTDPGGLPTPAVLEQYYANNLGANWIWQEFFFNDIPPWPPDEGLCLVIKWADGINGALVRWTLEAGNRLMTQDAGATWFLSGAVSLLYSVYGTYKENVTVATTYLTGIRVKIRTGSDPTTAMETGVSLLHVQDITP